MNTPGLQSILHQAGYDPEKVVFETIQPDSPLQDYRVAMELANEKANEHPGEYMLLSWYDRDRDFESPQHSSECHLDSAVPGYVDYGLSHDASLVVDIENGRFVFFYLNVES